MLPEQHAVQLDNSNYASVAFGIFPHIIQSEWCALYVFFSIRRLKSGSTTSCFGVKYCRFLMMHYEILANFKVQLHIYLSIPCVHKVLNNCVEIVKLPLLSRHIGKNGERTSRTKCAVLQVSHI